MTSQGPRFWHGLLVIATVSALLVAADADAATTHHGAHAAQASSAKTAVATGVLGAVIGKIIGPDNGVRVASGLVGSVRNVVQQNHFLAHVSKIIDEYLNRGEHEADLADADGDGGYRQWMLKQCRSRRSPPLACA
jgi:hypothetical protein